jgi:NAD+ kinase
MPDVPFRRVALVVHPTRDIDGAVGTLQRWTDREGLELVQLEARGNMRRVAEAGTVGADDLVVALGGDGTVLAALRAAGPTGTPVLGIACGSLGVLSAVTAEELDRSLDRFRAGDWIARSLPALDVASDAGADWAANDVVFVRRSAGQVTADVTLDDELYVRLAGDGLIVASPLGSSAYSMAAGGPLLASSARAVVCTPLAMHGGNAPPLVVPAGTEVRVEVHPSFAGFDVEIDGHTYPLQDLQYRVSLDEEKVTLATFDEFGLGLSGLRKRRLITDSPRVLARDDRAGHTRPGPSR